jgi:hypothetical protein
MPLPSGFAMRCGGDHTRRLQTGPSGVRRDARNDWCRFYSRHFHSSSISLLLLLLLLLQAAANTAATSRWVASV